MLESLYSCSWMLAYVTTSYEWDGHSVFWELVGPDAITVILGIYVMVQLLNNIGSYNF